MIKAIVIIINRSFKQGMSEDALYEATRGNWAKINAEKKRADYAVAIANGVIKAVYHIEKWEDASENRQRFTGSNAEDMGKYIGRNVGKKKQGDQDPTYFTDDLDEFVEGGGFQGIKVVEKQHALQAFDYIKDKGVKEESYGIFSVSERSKAKSKAVVHEEFLYAVKDTIRIAYLYAIGQKSDEQGDFSEKQINMFDAKMDHIGDHWQSIRAGHRLQKLGFEIRNFDEIKEEVIMSKNSDSYLNLLLQFKQIIFFGPPGTGKTFGAIELVKELFDVETGKELQEMHTDRQSKESLVEGGDLLKQVRHRWNIVQFHPSYNYEDFVYGINVSASGTSVIYEAKNRIFGEMCRKAGEEYKKAKEEGREPKKYALIIDEINRANVSAVLGELIYALEYRGKEIKISYSGTLTIPKNLYIIGTMNTADRTIGQIDYAVRRRFAFVHCPPVESVIKEQIGKGKANEESIKFFRAVDKIFDEYTSQDFDKQDVRIGHSYFLARGNELANKIIYQVIPILREYVKDGVLTESAAGIIEEIAKDAEELTDEPNLPPRKGELWFRWKHEDDDKYTFTEMAGHLAREVIADFIEKNSDKDIEYFETEFESIKLGSHLRVVSLEEGERADANNETKRYFTKDKYHIKLNNSKKVIISADWETRANDKTEAPKWRNFKDKMAEHGYSIGQCYIVSIGENERRSWRYCEEFGFIAAGGSENYHKVMKNLKKGDIVFAYLADDGVKDLELDKGVICYGEVISEAKLVSDFEIPKGGLLADCTLNGSQTYQDKFHLAFNEPGNEYPDMAVGVEWLADSLKKTFKVLNVPQGGSGGYIRNFPAEDIVKLKEKFNLDDKESGPKSFRWKYQNGAYTSPLGVGHTAREVITHFINKRLDEDVDKDIEYFKTEFESLRFGSEHPCIMSLEEGKRVNKDKKKKFYFIEHPVSLKNGEIIVISNQWGATRSYKVQWEEFKDKMAELGYSITVADESNK